MSDQSKLPPLKQRRFAVILMALFFGFALGHVFATQYLAKQVRYQDAFMGTPLTVDKATKVKIYKPWTIHTFSKTYYGRPLSNALIHQAYGVLGMTLLVHFGLGLAFAFKLKDQAFKTSHGSSRWATQAEIEKMDLLTTPAERIKAAKKAKKPLQNSDSVVVGKGEDGRIYYSSGPEHVLTFAPTRSGKGVGLVIPTLLTWTGSVVVTDIKGENFMATGWWRSLFSHVIYFDPTSLASARYNPLLEIRKGPEVIRDAMNIAEILGQRESGKEDRFWDGGAKKILSATILYVLYTQEQKSLGQVSRLLSNVSELVTAMLAAPLEHEPDVQSYIRQIAQSTKDAPETVRGGWAAGAQGTLDLWKDPVVDRVTSTSDFRLKDMQYAKSPVSLYVVTPAGDIERLSPLIRLFFQQLTDALTERWTDSGEDKHRLLMLLDEFPQFGNMAKIERAISYTAGYGIRWFFICQGLDQLDQKYGKDNGFLSNCHTRLAYRCNDEKNAGRLSKLLGETTGTKTQEGESGKKGFMSSMNSRSKSEVEFARPLMTPGELQQFDDSRLVVMIAGKYPIFAHKVTYYDDPHFIHKYRGKALALPSEPLTDFPSSVVSHDWGGIDPVQTRANLNQTHEASPSGQGLFKKDSPPSEEDFHGERTQDPSQIISAHDKLNTLTIETVSQAVAPGTQALEALEQIKEHSRRLDSVALSAELKSQLKQSAAQAVGLPNDLGLDLSSPEPQEEEPSPTPAQTPQEEVVPNFMHTGAWSALAPPIEEVPATVKLSKAQLAQLQADRARVAADSNASSPPDQDPSDQDAEAWAPPTFKL